MIERLNAALAESYAVERKLGEGGMATVFLAEDLRHHRKVALKVLKPELAAVVGAERFLEEIGITARLQHPNVLPLFDSGEADGFLFYVMPYVEDESLRDRLDRDRQLPVDEAVRIAREVAEALHSAHGQGVVHRDIKPANILISQGRPLVADFGIALAVSAAGGNRLTQTGLSLGTPHYVSPEQATGDLAVGPASDVYSLGCVLYEMLVGEPPYTGGTAQAVLGKVITTDPHSVTSQRRTVPPHVDAVVARALEKLPADRFASAADFARALSDEGFHHRTAKGATASPRKSYLAYAGWAAAAVVAAAWLSSFRGADADPTVRRLSIAIPEGASANEYMALTPDGSALILAEQDGGGLLLQRLDDVARMPIAGSRGSLELAVSPDGQSIAVPTASGLYVVPTTGGTPRTVVREGSICCARWSVDERIYFTDLGDGSVYRVPAGGGDPELVLQSESPGQVLTYYEPLPGTERAVVASDAESNDVVIVDLRTGRREVLTPGVRPFVTESGHLLFARDDGGLYAAPLDADAMQLTGSPVLMAEGVGITRGGLDAMFTYGRSGDLVYWALPEAAILQVNDLIWVDRDGRVTPVDSTWSGHFETVALSPDRTMAAVTRGAQEFDTEIWVKDLTTGLARRVTNYVGMNRRPVWSPDGTTLAFISDRDGKRAVFSVATEEFATPELLLEHPVEDIDEVIWSPNGEWLVYRTGTSDNRRDIYARRLRPDTSTIAVAAQPGIDERSPVLSPDGDWVAYISNEGGEDAVWLRPFPDVQRGSRQVSAGFAAEPVWSPSGREIFFRASPGVTSLTIQANGDIAAGAEQVLFSNQLSWFHITYRTFDHDADEDRFLMIRLLGEEETTPELILVQNFIEDVKARVGR